MSSRYSEDALIEQSCMSLFHDMGWDCINLQRGERLGSDGSIGRNSEEDVILRRPFYDALIRLNPDLPQQAYDMAFETISSDTSIKTLGEINFEKHQYLKDGIPVTYKNQKGEIVRNKKLKVFDFADPDRNQFLAVQQLWVEGKSKRKRRPDVIGFVNGIPLVFIELKAHHRKIRVAFDDNLTDYKDTIPHMFFCNAFIILSNGIDSKIGSITSRFEHFHEWKRIREEEEGRVSLETIIRGTCRKEYVLDILENFIVFDQSDERVIKLIARNHQFIGVNKAFNHFIARRQAKEDKSITLEEARKLGVFWHTQGSGKSYSMVFLSQKIHRKLQGSFTFLVVTDRNELDGQIYGTFEGVGAVTNKNARATSGRKLKELLLSDEKFIFTLIHKFNFDEVISERDDIIVISDEAHRTQGGTLALNMRKALPNASFIGFTGTPLFKDDQLTRRIFGDYVSVYDFKRSVEDGATVPLYYENRGEKLALDNPTINEQIRTAIEQADLDSDQADKLEQLIAREYPVLTAEKRLRSIARDVVSHFNSRGYKGKAMLVAIDKITAVKMYNFITEEWQKYLEQRARDIKKITDLQEQMTEHRALQWSRETEVAVVVSGEQNEIDKFRSWNLDIEPHRSKMNTRDLETEFKDEDNPFRFAIVCAMWITGFDVPSLSTLYLDKPLKSHTLMQTIARANRIHEGKNNGLIVDYIETYKSLLEALAIYAVGGDKATGGEIEPPVKPLEVLIADLAEAITATKTFLKGEVNFELETLVDSEGIDKIAAIRNGVDAVYTNDDTKAKFGVLAREVFKKYKALTPNAAIYEFRDERDAINAIYSVIADNRDEADITGLIKQVQDIVDESVERLNVVLEPTEDYGKKIDMSGLDFKRIEAEFLKTDKKRTTIQSLKEKVEKVLNRMLDENPSRINFYERYQEIIDEYNRGKDFASIKRIFDELLDLYRTLDDEQRRAQAEDLTGDELAVFDMLGTGKKISDKEKAEVKEAAKQLLSRLKENEFKVDRWLEKVQTASAVRKVINDYLFSNLPYPAYNDQDIAQKTEALYAFFRNRYSAA